MVNQPAKSRHGCLLAYLIFVIIANSGVALFYLFGLALKEFFAGIATWALLLLCILSFLNVVCAVALLRWKKWGFWGFCGISLAALIINIILDVGIVYIFTGLIGIAFLYGVLQIGKENKGWPQLS